MRLNALSALVVSRGVPRLVQNSQGGSAGHPRRSVSVFRLIWRRRSARASCWLMSTVRPCRLLGVSSRPRENPRATRISRARKCRSSLPLERERFAQPEAGPRHREEEPSCAPASRRWPSAQKHPAPTRLPERQAAGRFLPATFTRLYRPCHRPVPLRQNEVIELDASSA